MKISWRPQLPPGRVTADLAKALQRLNADVVLVVGDRVEAFAAAAAGHISGRLVAHVHGGDRALGQVDDSLRHAITKLAHLHFPATAQSAQRILRLGEDPRWVFNVGSPGNDSVRRLATPWAQLHQEYPMLKRRPLRVARVASGRCRSRNGTSPGAPGVSRHSVGRL